MSAFSWNRVKPCTQDACAPRGVNPLKGCKDACAPRGVNPLKEAAPGCASEGAR